MSAVRHTKMWLKTRAPSALSRHCALSRECVAVVIGQAGDQNVLVLELQASQNR
jgi:hypothetical protein